MSEIKKNVGFFVLLSGFMAVLCVLGVLLLPISAVAVVIVWAALFAHFRSIKYTLNGEKITISSGVIIRSVKELELGCVLWTSKISLCKAVITVLYTAGGSVFLFSDCDFQLFPPNFQQ